MELVFSRKDMAQAMEIAGRAVARSAILPVLSNVLISAGHDPLRDVSGDSGDPGAGDPGDGGESIYATATDLEIGIRTRISGQVVENGAITLPAKTFASVIKSLSEEDVKLITSKDRARICCQNGEFEMVGMPAHEFPSLMGEPNQDAQLELTEETKEKKETHFISLAPDAFGRMMRKTAFAAGRDEARYFLNGVHLSLKNDGSEGSGTLVKMAATDGTRLAVASASVEEPVEEGVGVIIPNRAVKELEKLAMRSDAVKMGFQENRIIFDIGDIALVSVLLEGQYPDYQQVIPDQSRINLKADTGHLLSVARRMAQVADPKLPCVKLEIEGSKLTVSASSAYVGDGCEEMHVDKDGDDIEIAVNVHYLMDALRVIDSQETLIGINSESQPIVIKPSLHFVRGQAAGDYLCVLMPMRV